jgi:ferric-dicitrate binding protein FerR (iron transport regulator)
MQRFWWSVGTLHAVVQAANGQVYRVSDARSDSLTTGAALGTGERIRTARGAEAVVRLNDGSTVEMDERSEFSTENAQGTTIHLNRGKIIVQLRRRDRKLLSQHLTAFVL